MPRRSDAFRETEEQRDQLYRKELAQWSAWLRQQDHLRALTPKAMRVIDEALDASGPEAVKVALAVLRLMGAPGGVQKPQLVLLNLASPEEVAARLAALGVDGDVPALPTGQIPHDGG